MLVRTKKPLTKIKRRVSKPVADRKKKCDNTMILVSCPVLNAAQIKQYLEKHGCICVDDREEWTDAKGLFAERIPANMLIGARGKENITQIKLSELTGIPRRHISDMENGRRTIGRHNAIKLGEALNINYRLFL